MRKNGERPKSYAGADSGEVAPAVEGADSKLAVLGNAKRIHESGRTSAFESTKRLIDDLRSGLERLELYDELSDEGIFTSVTQNLHSLTLRANAAVGDIHKLYSVDNGGSYPSALANTIKGILKDAEKLKGDIDTAVEVAIESIHTVAQEKGVDKRHIKKSVKIARKIGRSFSESMEPLGDLVDSLNELQGTVEPGKEVAGLDGETVLEPDSVEELEKKEGEDSAPHVLDSASVVEGPDDDSLKEVPQEEARDNAMEDLLNTARDIKAEADRMSPEKGASIVQKVWQGFNGLKNALKSDAVSSLNLDSNIGRARQKLVALSDGLKHSMSQVRRLTGDVIDSGLVTSVTGDSIKNGKNKLISLAKDFKRFEQQTEEEIELIVNAIDTHEIDVNLVAKIKKAGKDMLEALREVSEKVHGIEQIWSVFASMVGESPKTETPGETRQELVEDKKPVAVPADTELGARDKRDLDLLRDFARGVEESRKKAGANAKTHDDAGASADIASAEPEAVENAKKDPDEEYVEQLMSFLGLQVGPAAAPDAGTDEFWQEALADANARRARVAGEVKDDTGFDVRERPADTDEVWEAGEEHGDGYEHEYILLDTEGQSIVESMEEEILKPKDSKLSAWIKGRALGVVTAGFSESVQARRFSDATRQEAERLEDVMNRLEGLGPIAQEWRDMRNDGRSLQEIYEANMAIVRREVDLSVANLSSQLLDSKKLLGLIPTGPYRDVFGQKVMAMEERVEEFRQRMEDQFATELNADKALSEQKIYTYKNEEGEILHRSSEVLITKNEFRGEMRRILDSKWWHRKVYSALARIPWLLGVKPLLMGSKTVSTGVPAGVEDVARSVLGRNVVSIVPESVTRDMSHSIWNTVKDYALERDVDLTPSELVRLSIQVARENAVKVPIWGLEDGVMHTEMTPRLIVLDVVDKFIDAK